MILRDIHFVSYWSFSVNIEADNLNFFFFNIEVDKLKFEVMISKLLILMYVLRKIIHDIIKG